MARVDFRDSSAPGISAPIAGAGVSATVGLAELAHAALAAHATPSEIQRGLLLALAVYPALGAAAGLACWLARRVSLAPAAAGAALVALAAGAAEGSGLQRVAALALGAVALRLAAPIFERFESLPRARIAASVALLAQAGVCALAARALPAYGPRWALGAAVAAVGAAILVWTPRVRASALLLTVASTGLVWQGAQHVQRLAPPRKPSPSAPSVLLVTIDALRADHVGALGDRSARTPHLDALAAQGALFANAYAHSPDSGASHASILGARVPSSAERGADGRGLEASVETLADALARAGYVTAAFPSSRAAAPLSGRFQYADADLRERRRFPAFAFACVALRPLEARIAAPSDGRASRPAAATTDLAARFLSVHAAAPTFTWVHYADPALPYAPPADLLPATPQRVSGDWLALGPRERAAIVEDPARLAALRALYEAEIASVDRSLGRLLAAAREAAPAGGLAIVVVGDRGEPMGEHGRYWAPDLHDATLHVPLVMVPPPRVISSPRVVTPAVRLIDVAPTLLDWLGLPKLASAEGASLAPLAAGASSESPGPLIAVAEPEPATFAPRAVAVRRGAWKLLRWSDGWTSPSDWVRGAAQLFEVATDPAEKTDLSAARPDVVAELSQLLPPGWRRPPLVSPAPTKPGRAVSSAPAPEASPASRPDESAAERPTP